MMMIMMKRLALTLVVVLCVCFALAAVAAAEAQAPIKVVLDGVELVFDVQPVIISDRTMVPMRAIFEALGADVYWDDTNSIVTALKGPDAIKAAIGDEFIHINNDSIKMDVAPVVIDSRTLVPARFISEALGCDVKWDELSNTVLITSVSDDLSYGITEKLLQNSAKITRLGHITHYNGQVYAADYLCMPEWNPIESSYIGAFAIHNDTIYRTEGSGTGDESTRMFSSSLDGSNENYLDLAENWGSGTCIIGDKLIYTRFSSDGETVLGLRIYDTDTSEKVDLPLYGRIISYDDDYLYMIASDETYSNEYMRVKWDGSQIEKASNLEGISTQYFDSYRPGFDSDYLYYIVRGNATSIYGGFYDDGVVGITIISTEGLKWRRYLQLAENNNERVHDSVFISNGWVYFNDETAIYRMNIEGGARSKVCDFHPDIQLSYIGYVDNIDGYLYMQGYTGHEDIHNMALFRAPVGGGTMEHTGKTWFES